MKNYFNFSSKNEYITNIDIDKCVRLFKNTSCFETFKTNKFEISKELLVYRDVRYHFEDYSSYNIINPTEITRISPYASKNYYNLLFSNLPSWNDFPKRNKSLICADYTGINNRVMGFGHCFIVFPFDGLFGVCSDDDIWSSFSKSISKNYTIEQYFEYLEEDIEDVFNSKSLTNSIPKEFDKDWNVFVECLSKYDEMREKISTITFIQLIQTHIDTEKWLNKEQSTIDLLNEVFNPKTNDFITLQYTGQTLPRNREMWTESNSLFVKYSSYDEFIVKLKKYYL